MLRWDDKNTTSDDFSLRDLTYYPSPIAFVIDGCVTNYSFLMVRVTRPDEFTSQNPLHFGPLYKNTFDRGAIEICPGSNSIKCFTNVNS